MSVWISLQLRAGKKLQPAKNGLQDESSTLLVSYSSAYRKRLSLLEQKGYRVRDGEIRCIVAWKAEDDLEETAVLLPDIWLEKSAGTA